MARAAGKLAEYLRKRDFTKTEEPAGAVATSRTRDGWLRFVIQKHAATRLHFDLRLELDGVMKSWAVPKGPSLDPSQRRLAMHVEDHPVEYNTFEGIIPKGQYGGGTVMLWDRGTYRWNGDRADDPVASLRRGYHAGRLKIFFRGKRLRGGYSLVRMSGREDDAKPPWLLIKESDEYADPSRDIVADVVTSVATRRTMEQITTGRSRRWTRAGGEEPPAERTRRSAGSRQQATSDGIRRSTASAGKARERSSSRAATHREPDRARSAASPEGPKRRPAGARKARAKAARPPGTGRGGSSRSTGRGAKTAKGARPPAARGVTRGAKNHPRAVRGS